MLFECEQPERCVTRLKTAARETRLQIAIMHFNENSDREQAKLPDGSERVNIAFPKYKKGEHSIKKILVKCTYSKYTL